MQAFQNLGAFHKPATILLKAASTGSLLLNASSLHSFMLAGVNNNFTSTTGGMANRKIALRLSVRLSCGKRSITGQIVVALQRRLVVASPSAQSAKGNQCN